MEQVLAADGEMIEYLKACAERMMSDDKIRSVIPAHLYADERFEIIMEKMKRIAKGRL